MDHTRWKCQGCQAGLETFGPDLRMFQQQRQTIRGTSVNNFEFSGEYLDGHGGLDKAGLDNLNLI